MRVVISMKNTLIRMTIAIAVLGYASRVSATNVGDFIAAAESLQKKGRAAIFTPEFNLLNNEADESLAIWKSRAPLARPKVCPTGDATNMTVTQFIDLLKTIPIVQRGISVRVAVSGIMNKNYRCNRKK